MGKVKAKPKKNGRPKDSSLPDVMTLAEAAAYLRVEEAELERLAANGQPRGRRSQNGWRFTRRGLLAWVDGYDPAGPQPGPTDETPEERAEYMDTLRTNRDEWNRQTGAGRYAPE